MSDGLSELEANSDTIYEFLRKNATTTIGMCSRIDLDAFLREFMKQRLSAFPSEAHSTGRATTLKYHDFIALIAPKNRDFTELLK